MKPTPADIDRNAATLFVPAPGMRFWLFGVECRAVDEAEMVEPTPGPCVWYMSGPRMDDGGLLSAAEPVGAIDTDDPATVGCMLAQVEAALEAIGRPDGYLHPWGDGWAMTHGRAIRRYAGATKGAALVAAMEAVKRPA